MKSKVSKAKEMTVDELAIIMAKSFSSMDEKFEKRFDEMDKKFIAIDGKFEAIDKRFDEMDKKINFRFDSLSNRLDRFVLDNVTHEEHRLLEVRVSKIEKKFKIA